jgi:Flp pilus assembly protein TadD
MRSISTLYCCFALLLITSCSSMTTNQESSETQTNRSKHTDPQLVQELQAIHRLFMKNKVKQAKSQLQTLIKQHPNHAAPHINLGIIQLSEDDPQTAEQSFKTALNLNGKSLPAHNQLGIALRMQGRFKEAEQAYQETLKLEPAYKLAHRNLGILYDLYLAKPELALQHYQHYQVLAGSKDKEIESWIVDLQRRLGKTR